VRNLQHDEERLESVWGIERSRHEEKGRSKLLDKVEGCFVQIRGPCAKRPGKDVDGEKNDLVEKSLQTVFVLDVDDCA